MKVLIECPIQTKERFSESSGLTVRQIEQGIKEGLIPSFKRSERLTLVNVAMYASQLINVQTPTVSE